MFLPSKQICILYFTSYTWYICMNCFRNFTLLALTNTFTCPISFIWFSMIRVLRWGLFAENIFADLNSFKLHFLLRNDSSKSLSIPTLTDLNSQSLFIEIQLKYRVRNLFFKKVSSFSFVYILLAYVHPFIHDYSHYPHFLLFLQFFFYVLLFCFLCIWIWNSNVHIYNALHFLFGFTS